MGHSAGEARATSASSSTSVVYTSSSCRVGSQVALPSLEAKKDDSSEQLGDVLLACF